MAGEIDLDDFQLNIKFVESVFSGGEIWYRYDTDTTSTL